MTEQLIEQGSRAIDAAPGAHDPYVIDGQGIHRPPVAVVHRDDEYPSEGFESLQAMQRDHFWYRGRHRFILHFARRVTPRAQTLNREAIDLGGGCGGWVGYLERRSPDLFRTLSLGDSSATALEIARQFVSPRVRRYQIDLLNLQWRNRWDVAFLLDVLEHVPEDRRALEQIRGALRPGGYLIVTTPALERFRTSIDDMSHHVRRYSRADLARLGAEAGLEAVTTRYFMFFLSPLLLLSRQRIPEPSELTMEQIREYMTRSARIPPKPVNAALASIFGMETPLGAWLPFPWGTSVLAVFRRPD